MGKYKKAAKHKGKRRWRIKALITKFRGKCNHCGIQVTLTHCAKDQATVDHIFPLSKGGEEGLANLQLLCRKCNQAKGNSVIDDDGDFVEAQ